jgi:aarF domain-containing kinase
MIIRCGSDQKNQRSGSRGVFDAGESTSSPLRVDHAQELLSAILPRISILSLSQTRPILPPLMRSFSIFGRLCGRRGSPFCQSAPRFRIPRHQQSFTRWTRKHSLKDPRQRRIPSLLATAAALSPAAFVQLGENHEEGKTGEMHMLEVSRQEISKKVPDDVHGVRRIYKTVVYVFDQWIYEPIATSFRFLHLVLIFVPVIVTIPAAFLGPRRKDHDDERVGTIWWYGFLVASMERAGPAFIKLGQWAASRSDIFPAEMCRQMSELHSNAPAHSLRHSIRTIREAFGGRTFDEIFEEFDEKPLGVGAIAQVYKARLKPDLAKLDDSELEAVDNQRLSHRIKKNVDALVKSSPQRVPSAYVAIKVLHPKVERTVRRDLRIMGVFAAIINAIPTLEWLDLPNEVSNFGEMMRLQLDLRIEAANLTILRKHFQRRTTAWFPYPYTDFTTRTLLVEEFAQGIPLAAFLECGGGVFQKDIANEGLDAFLHMLLIDNFVHADLHPGNIMVNFYKPAHPELPSYLSRQDASQPSTASEIDASEAVLSRLRPHVGKKKEWLAALADIDKDGYIPQLIFIDTGLVTELNAKNRTNFLDLFRSIAEFDGYKAGHLMIERCRQPDAVINGEIFALKMQHLVLAVKGQTFALGNIKIGDVLSEVLGMVRSHHVRMEGDFVNVVISILLLEGIGRSLDPDLDLFKSALPILRQLGSSDPSAVLKSFREGDFSLLKIWVGLEARRFFQASAESVEMCVKYDLLSPNV